MAWVRFRKNVLPKEWLEMIASMFVLTIIPIFSIFELFVIFPYFYEPGSLWFMVHLLWGIFLVHNIAGNYAFVLCTDTSTKDIILCSRNNHHYCQRCNSYAPPRAWHCQVCNFCILRRDHHCLFTGCCIGYFNYRYFVMCVFYVVVGALYASYLNFFYLRDQLTDFSLLSIIQTSFPIAILYFGEGKLGVMVCMVLFWILMAVIVFMVVLTAIHISLIRRGTTQYEFNNEMYDYDLGWKQNFIHVLGKKWMWSLISPFAHSELPGNGIDWHTKEV
ncbi:hypothetical protein C0J52_22349 [Blattella germanica]|nr:hypothetical protein C0J52_22349 [Blattella germanica]